MTVGLSLSAAAPHLSLWSQTQHTHTSLLYFGSLNTRCRRRCCCCCSALCVCVCVCVHFYRSPSCWMARWWATTLQGMPCHSSALNNISFFCCPLNKNGPFLLFLKKKIKILNFNELPRCHFSSGKFLWKLKYFAIYFNIICIFKLRILIRPKIVVWFFFEIYEHSSGRVMSCGASRPSQIRENDRHIFPYLYLLLLTVMMMLGSRRCLCRAAPAAVCRSRHRWSFAALIAAPISHVLSPLFASKSTWYLHRLTRLSAGNLLSEQLRCRIRSFYPLLLQLEHSNKIHFEEEKMAYLPVFVRFL